MTQIFRVSAASEYRKAGPTDLIELVPVPGGHPLYVNKWFVELLVTAIVENELIHVSGPTGTAKTSLIEALHMGPGNFQAICKALDLPARPLRVYPIEMAIYEAPGELYQRRALYQGNTWDEPSNIVLALDDAAKTKDESYPLIWLREMGRVHSSSVQGGLLDLMVRGGHVLLPNGRRIESAGISWIADSNYQAEQDSTHTLVTLDDALKRRFSVNLTLDYLSAEQDRIIVGQLASTMNGKRGPVEPELVTNVVKLGMAIRKHRREGDLQSVAPPTIYGYLAYVRMATRLPHLPPQQIALATLLGNASHEDRKFVQGVLNEVYGLSVGPEEDPAQVGNLF